MSKLRTWMILTLLFASAGCGPLLERGIERLSTTIPAEVDTRALLIIDRPIESYTDADIQAVQNTLINRAESMGITAQVESVGDGCLLLGLSHLEDTTRTVSDLVRPAVLELVDFSGMDQIIVADATGQPVLTTYQVDNELSFAGSGDEPITMDGEPFETIITGDSIVAAVVSPGFDGISWQINFELNAAAGDIFFEHTSDHLGEPIAIVLDGQLLTAPVVQSPLTTSGVITGNFTEEESRTLATQLQSGALTLPLIVYEITLGADASVDTSPCFAADE